MSTSAQINANRLNAEKSTGPVSAGGKASSSQNRGSHYLSSTCTFRVLSDESENEFNFSVCELLSQYTPEKGAEYNLVVRMAEHEWMRHRALRHLDRLFDVGRKYAAPVDPVLQQSFALMMRYHTMHEKAFYNALNMLLKLKAEKAKEQIGFERKTAQAEQLEMRKQRDKTTQKAKQVDAECKIIRTLCRSANNPEALQLARDVQTRHQAA